MQASAALHGPQAGHSPKNHAEVPLGRSRLPCVILDVLARATRWQQEVGQKVGPSGVRLAGRVRAEVEQAPRSSGLAGLACDLVHLPAARQLRKKSRLKKHSGSRSPGGRARSLGVRRPDGSSNAGARRSWRGCLGARKKPRELRGGRGHTLASEGERKRRAVFAGDGRTKKAGREHLAASLPACGLVTLPCSCSCCAAFRSCRDSRLSLRAAHSACRTPQSNRAGL